MPKTRRGGWIIDDRRVVLKRNPYRKLLKKKVRKKT